MSKYLLPSFTVRQGYMYNLVKPPRPLDRGIQNTFEVSSPNHDYFVARFETVHFGQDLVYGVSGVRRVQGFTRAGYRVDFVDKDYGWSLNEGNYG